VHTRWVHASITGGPGDFGPPAERAVSNFEKAWFPQFGSSGTVLYSKLIPSLLQRPLARSRGRGSHGHPSNTHGRGFQGTAGTVRRRLLEDHGLANEA
jgi:hypothetical protein